MSARVMSWDTALVRSSVLGALICICATNVADAQPRRGGGIAPEALAKVQTAQATAVAAALSLDAEKSAKLISTFTTFQKAQAEDRPERRGNRGDWETMRKQQEARTAALTTEFKTFLDEAAAKEAASTLGGFNRGWDRMVGVVLGFGLEGAKESQALGYTLEYVKTTSQAQTGQGEERDFEAMRSAIMAAKKSLDSKIMPLLSEEQKTDWAEETDRGARGGRRGGDADGAGRRGGDGAERRGDGAERREDGGERGNRRQREANDE